MLVPFGTRVVDSNGKGVGTVSRLVLHSQSQQVAALVVHQGVLNRREVVVPISKNKEPVRVVAPVPAHMRARLVACGWNGAEEP